MRHENTDTPLLLAKALLAAEPEQRLQAAQCRQHPALWEDEQKGPR